MKTERFVINNIPAVLIGDKSDKVFMYMHGLLRSKEDSFIFAENAVDAGYQVLGIDLPGHGERIFSNKKFYPPDAVPEIKSVYNEIKYIWSSVSIRADGIGAWLAMLALQHTGLKQALFVSPVTDMENIILKDMHEAGITEEELKEKGEIETDFGQTLSWEYLCMVRNNPIKWKTPTKILYGMKDNIVSISEINDFAKEHNRKLTVMEKGEHIFQTPEQRAFLSDWEKKYL